MLCLWVQSTSFTFDKPVKKSAAVTEYKKAHDLMEIVLKVHLWYLILCSCRSLNHLSIQQLDQRVGNLLYVPHYGVIMDYQWIDFKVYHWHFGHIGPIRFVMPHRSFHHCTQLNTRYKACKLICVFILNLALRIHTPKVLLSWWEMMKHVKELSRSYLHWKAFLSAWI